MSTELGMLLTVLGVVLIVAIRAVLGGSDQPGAHSDHAATRFVPLQDLATLEGWWASSREQPVVLFLHDPGCPISARAYRHMARLGGTVPLLDVRYGEQLSQSIEARTGIRHESPQVIVLRQGQARWSASHYGITTEAVAGALKVSE
jgi:bacillithiol system protein YtxJ